MLPKVPDTIQKITIVSIGDLQVWNFIEIIGARAIPRSLQVILDRFKLYYNHIKIFILRVA